jgi:hypothetical protein
MLVTVGVAKEGEDEKGEDEKVFKETEVIQIADEMQHTNTPAGLIGLLFIYVVYFHIYRILHYDTFSPATVKSNLNHGYASPKPPDYLNRIARISDQIKHVGCDVTKARASASSTEIRTDGVSVRKARARNLMARTRTGTEKDCIH